MEYYSFEWDNPNGGRIVAYRLALAPAPILAIGRAPSGVRAGVAELVDALDLGSSIARCGGSSPFARTNSEQGLSVRRASAEFA